MITATTAKSACLYILITLLFIAKAGAETLIINEVMQSTVDCVFTEHDFPDSWVEIYNSSDRDIAMNGYSLGLTGNPGSAWCIATDDTIKAGDYLLIYCDKEARGLHTDFRLDSGAGSLYLFDPSGNRTDYVYLTKQPAPNVAAGRSKTDGAWGYFATATPGADNPEQTVSEILPEPLFSAPGCVRVKSGPVELVVAAPSQYEDVRLCITTDGREPTVEDAVEGLAWHKKITTSTVVRAKLISDRAISPRSTTHSYIFHPRATTLDIVSIVTDSDYLYGTREGIFADGRDSVKNYQNNWRRPVNIEYYQGRTHRKIMNQLCETRVQGGISRTLPQKSIALYANKRFGEKRFSANLWKDKPDVTEVKSFILRNGGNTFSFERINDQLAQTVIGRNTPNLDWQAHTPAIIYINGYYRGIADVRERSNEDYVEANYNGLEEIDMLENYQELKTGHADGMVALINYYNRPDASLPQLSEMIDVDNFLDMFVIKAFGNDTDFPHNNIVCWRQKEPYAKWRWILKDADRFGIYPYRGEVTSDYCDHIERCTDGSDPNRTRNVALFKFFITDTAARELFIDRMAVYMGDFLQTSYGQSIIDEMAEAIRPEFTDYMQSYLGDSKTAYKNWTYYISQMRNVWWEQRRQSTYMNLRNRFGLGNLFDLVIDHEEQEMTFNGLKLSQPEFHGMYYAGRPMSLVADDMSEWTIETVCGADDVKTHTFYGKSLNITPDSECTRMTVSCRASTGDGPDNGDSYLFEVIDNTVNVWSDGSRIESAEVYSLAGIRLAGIYGNTAESCISLNLPAITTSSRNGRVVLVVITDTTGRRYSKKLRI